MVMGGMAMVMVMGMVMEAVMEVVITMNKKQKEEGCLASLENT